MKSIAVNAIRPLTPPEGTLYLDEDYILCSPDIPVSSNILNMVRAWGYRQLFLDEDTQPTAKALTRGVSEGDVTHLFVEESQKTNTERRTVNKAYVEFLESFQRATDQFSRKGILNVDDIAAQAKEIHSNLKMYWRVLLQTTEMDRNGFPYLTCHSVNTSILAMAVSETMKVPAHRVIEIGMAGLVHEIGMFHQTYSKFQSADRQLTPEESKTLRAHPVLSYKILKEKGFPVGVCMGALEHHEKENGSGYPQGIKAESITASAKIIAVVSSYDALVSTRPHRESRDAHASILDLLREMGKSFNEQVVKCLVLTIGLYPLGSIVELKGGPYAQVYDFAPETPKQPQIKILTDSQKGPLTEFPIVKVGEKAEWEIIRTLSREGAFKLRNSGIIAS